MTNLEVIKRNTVEIIPENELEAKIKEKRPLRVKLGIDPTAPNIHIGNVVCLRKLREFQDLGHIAVLIVGNFTAKIGDPSGRSVTRPQITDAEIEKNMEDYKPQIFKILKEEQTEFRYNSDWLSKLTSEEIIRLASKFTVSQVLEREEISKRFEKEEPIALHEIFYALFQGYDSYAVKADIELGATEQKFNLLFGREMQRIFGQSPQVAITMPILEGLDGVRKMSKSYNNYVGITESPDEMFGKLMSIPDTSIINYFKLATELPSSEITDIEKELKKSTTNPMDYKLRLAKEIVAVYHSQPQAIKAEENFLKVFRNKEVPEDIPVFTPQDKKIWIVKLLVDSGAVPSRNEARRIIQQGGLTINGTTVNDTELELEVKGELILQIGKRKFLKVLPL